MGWVWENGVGGNGGGVNEELGLRRGRRRGREEEGSKGRFAACGWQR